MTSVLDRTTDFLEGASRNRREIVSPEGVPLPVELADYGERAGAFLLDLVFWLLATILIFAVLVLLLLKGIDIEVGASVATFIAFLVRNLYFIHFELSWQGATPGKRIMRLRAIDRRGGPLLPGAVIARNLTREIEAFLPLGLLLSLWLTPRGTPIWEEVSLGAWLLLFTCLPFFNRDRMRAGDLIAGTMVVALPRRTLLGDLAEATALHVFTEKQLKAYGAFELQILEELLRNGGTSGASQVRREVCEKIRRKIDWPAPVLEKDTDHFLAEFYTAERAYLEREQLFGKPRLDKHDQGGATR